MNRSSPLVAAPLLAVVVPHSGLFRATRGLSIPIPPQLIRLITTGALLFVQAFVVAYQREAAAAEKRSTEETVKLPMGDREALAVLGMNETLKLPLSSSGRAEAEKRFGLLMEKAKQSNNLFLQGKISAAYRRCVNDDWDAQV